MAQRLRSWLYPTARARRDDYEFVVRSQTGSLLTSRTSDPQGYPFSVYGYNEWRNWAVALACCARGDTIIEIGANIGTETIGFADIVGPNGSVHAFEPLPSNVAALEKSLKLNPGTGNVRVHPLAVSDTAGKRKFLVPPAELSGIGHVLRATDAADREVREVDSVTLDSFSGRLGPSALIVIDAEGEEVRILRGARQYIAAFQPVIVLEASAEALRPAGFDLRDLLAELEGQGYQCHRIARFALSSKDLATYPHATNWTCIPAPKRGLRRTISTHIRRCGCAPCIPGLNPMTLR